MKSGNKSDIPFFSVIICTYNRKTLITRALKSLVGQSENDWEAIIVDDGSTDNTYDTIKELLRSIDKIKYYKQDNQGSGAARNYGIQQSNGEWITFLDSDDEYSEEHLASIREEIDSNPEVEFFLGKTIIIGDPLVPDLNNSGSKIHIDNCKACGTFVIKRNVFDKIGLFPTLRFGEDNAFFKKAEKANTYIKELNKRTYIYHRDTDDSLCNNLTEKNGKTNYK
jgi:glycosyltransferase involved in cell wall biosynthesis